MFWQETGVGQSVALFPVRPCIYGFYVPVLGLDGKGNAGRYTTVAEKHPIPLVVPNPFDELQWWSQTLLNNDRYRCVFISHRCRLWHPTAPLPSLKFTSFS